MAKKKPDRIRKGAKGATPDVTIAHLLPREWHGLEPGTASPVLQIGWIWPQVFQADSINLIEGRKNSGKSSILAAIVAHFTGGPSLPGVAAIEGSPVIWIGPEEGWTTCVLPRLVAAGADHAWITRLAVRNDEGRAIRLSIPSGIHELSEIVRRNRVRAIVLDPISALCDPGIDLRHEQQIRSYLEPLAGLCADLGCTIFGSRHLRKGSAGDPLDSGLGGVAVGNCSQTIWRVDKHPERADVRVFCNIAGNHVVEKSTYLFSIVAEKRAAKVVWRGVSELTTEAICEGRRSASEIDEASDALVLLRQLLADGARQAVTVVAEAKSAGVGERSLRAAKAVLRVPSERRVTGPQGEACWYWLPPPGGFPAL